MNNPETKPEPLPPAPSSALPLVRRPRHKWFASYDPKADEGWWGPHDTVEAAAMEALCNNGSDRIFVTQGHKLPKDERYMPEWDWEVDAARAFEIVLPKMKIKYDNAGRQFPELKPSSGQP